LDNNGLIPKINHIMKAVFVGGPNNGQQKEIERETLPFCGTVRFEESNDGVYKLKQDAIIYEWTPHNRNITLTQEELDKKYPHRGTGKWATPKEFFKAATLWNVEDPFFDEKTGRYHGWATLKRDGSQGHFTDLLWNT